MLRATNRLGEAEPLYRRALAIDEASLGKDHPTVARDLNNLAGLLRATNRLGEAEPLYRRALAIFLALEHAIGREHPSRVTVQGNYESLLAAMGRTRPRSPPRSPRCGRRLGWIERDAAGARRHVGLFDRRPTMGRACGKWARS